MRQLKNNLTKILLIVFVLTLGIFIGLNLTADDSGETLYNSGTIAIVNLDDGIEYGGEYRNFAKEILENYPDNYNLTGLDDARSGLDDGRYAAYIMLPSDFSKNTVSVNGVPQKSLLKYEISGNLNQEATDKAWQNVMKFKGKVNDDIGYVYIDSILSEFHKGQDNALKVIANDSKDKDVLMAISNLDLVSILDLKEVERLQNEIENLDINPDFEKNQAIIESIDLAYKTYLSDSEIQLNQLKQESEDLKSDNQSIIEASEDIKNLISEDGTKNYNLSNSIAFLEQYNTYLSNDLTAIINTMTNDESDNLNSKNNYVGSRTSELDDLLGQLQSNHKSMNLDQKNDLKNDIAQLFQNSQNTSIDWNNDFSSVVTEFVSLKEDEKKMNAENYIDKVILNQLLQIDLSLIPDYSTFITIISSNTASNSQLQNSLAIYAQTIGADENTYSLGDYIADNQNVWQSLPGISDTLKSDQLEIDITNAVKSDAGNYFNNQLNQVEIDVVDKIDQLKVTHIDNDIQTQSMITTYKNDLSNVPLASLVGYMADIQDIDTIDKNEVTKKVDIDLNPLAVEQSQNKNALQSTVNNHSLLNLGFHNNLMNYVPKDYIDDKEINGFVREYSSGNKETQQKVESKNSEYLNFVSDAYGNSDEQVFSMRDDIFKYQQESDDVLSQGLEEAKSSREISSKENSDLMTSFTKKLTYTRNGTVANNVAYDFMANPIEIEGDKSFFNIQKNKQYLPLVFAGISSLCLIGLGIQIIIKKNKSREEEE